jgi:hypothetical protein
VFKDLTEAEKKQLRIAARKKRPAGRVGLLHLSLASLPASVCASLCASFSLSASTSAAAAVAAAVAAAAVTSGASTSLLSKLFGRTLPTNLLQLQLSHATLPPVIELSGREAVTSTRAP